MSKTALEIPEHMKKTLRTLMLSQMNTDTFDVFEIELFAWHVKETEALIQKMLSSEQTYIQEQVAGGVPDINDSGMVAAEYFTKRIRYSHVIYLTSLLESCLERACSNLSIAIGREQIPFRLNELKGDQWSKRRTFLERYGRFVLSNEFWPKTLITVRNYLVHENGSTEHLKDNDRKLLENCSGLNIESYEIRIEEDYIQDAFQAVKLFVKAVDEEVEKVVQREAAMVSP